MFLRAFRYRSVRAVDAGVEPMRSKTLPAWEALRGYRMSCVVHAPETEELTVLVFWGSHEDERAGNQAVPLGHDESVRLWAPDTSQVGAFEVAVVVQGASRPAPGTWVRITETERIGQEWMQPYITAWEAWMVPRIQQMDGFQAGMLPVDRAAGKAWSMSFWEDKLSLHNRDVALARRRVEAAKQFGFEVARSTAARVVLTDMPAVVMV